MCADLHSFFQTSSTRPPGRTIFLMGFYEPVEGIMNHFISENIRIFPHSWNILFSLSNNTRVKMSAPLLPLDMPFM